ncbi:MAG: SPFH domain-containing protein [Cellulosilyticaceae bacterium]
MGPIIGIIVLLVFILIVAISSIKIVKQSTVGIVMRLGKFSRLAETGVNFIFPFVEQIYRLVDLRESVLDFAPQAVITKDNVTMQIDTVVYFRVTDPVNYVFEIANPMSAIENLTATTLRNIIGELDLDETLTSRDIINTRLRVILDEATDKWGIKVNRVELKNIIPPRDIQDSMEKQMRAERQRREAVLTAEGEKAASILEAEGQKASAILNAEAQKESLIRSAEGQKQAEILKAEGEAEAILKLQHAKAEGLKAVFTAMKESNVDDNILALRSMEALEKIAEGDSSKLVLPSDAVNFLGTFKGIKEVMGDK